MTRLSIPGMPEGTGFKAPSPDAQAVIAALGQVGRLLQGIISQLDYLIRMESGALTKGDMKRRFAEFDAQQAAQAAAAEQTEQPKLPLDEADDVDV